MIKHLDIVDGRARKAKPCAFLTYNTETEEYSIRIAENATINDVPMMMEPFVEKGQLEMGPEWSRRWVEERVVPPGRQNLGEILRAHGLEEYNAFALLEASCGTSSQDYFVVQLPTRHAKDARAETRRAAGRAVSCARREAGLKQHELATLAGIDQSVLSRVETGKTNVTIDLLHSLANALGKSVEISFV